MRNETDGFTCKLLCDVHENYYQSLQCLEAERGAVTLGMFRHLCVIFCVLLDSKTVNFEFRANVLECRHVADGNAVRRFYGSYESETVLLRFCRVHRGIDPITTDKRSAAAFC